MTKILNVRVESNLGFRWTSRITSIVTSGNVEFFDRVTGLAREPHASNKTNLIVVSDKGGEDNPNPNYEIMIFGTVGNAVNGISPISGILRNVKFDGSDFSANLPGKQHAAKSEGGCVNVAQFWNGIMRVMAGTDATGGSNFKIGDETASDISVVFQNDHTTKPKFTFDDGNGYFVPHWGDNQPTGGTYITGGVFADLTEADTYPWPDHGAIIVANGVTYFREGGNWVENQAGGSVADASETGAGKVEEATQTQNNNGDSVGETLAKIFATPSKNAKTIQDGKWVYAVDSAGTDTYVATFVPALTELVDGQPLYIQLATGNTGPATLNPNGLGDIPMTKGDYVALGTGDYAAKQKVHGQVCVRSVTFNAAFTGGETSGTLSGNWADKTGVYSVIFSNGDRKNVTLTLGATTATWSGGLSGAATADAKAQWFQLHTLTNGLFGGGDGGNDHFHLKGTNNDSWLVTGGAQTSVKAHGLGRLPKIVTIYWGTTTSSADLGDSNHGTILYDGTTQRNLKYNSLVVSQGQFGSTTGACTVRIDNVAQFSFAVTFDSTNVTLTSSAYSNTKTVDYIWVAE